MPDVRWSDDFERRVAHLPVGAQRDLWRAVAILHQFPEIGVEVSEGRFRGLRRVILHQRWHLYYRVIGPGRTVELRAIRDARRRPI